MTHTAQTPYDSMSREQLISALIDHDATLSEIYSIIHLDNKKMAPGEKLFWIGARNVLAREKPNEDGLVRLPTDAISDFNGMSDTSNNRYANNLIERFGAKKETVPYITKAGQECKLIYIDRREVAWKSPWEVDLPEEKERTINGNGKYCPHCTTFNLKVSTRRLKYQEVQECECCGYVKISPVLDDKEELTPGEHLPEKIAIQPEDLLTEEVKDQKSASPIVYTCGVSADSDFEEGVQPEDLLAELKSLPVWCCHRAKVPYDVSNLKARTFPKAKPNDYRTWTTYDQAQAIYEEFKNYAQPFDGIGPMNNGEHVFIDLDHCIIDGQLSQLAKDTIALIDSYTEISQSGTGIHIIAKGTIAGFDKGIKKPEIEIYPNNRFFVFTGKHLEGTPARVEDRQEELTLLYEEYAPAQDPEHIEQNAADTPPCYTSSRSDEEILDKARKATNGAKFADLYDGETLGFRSQSEADLALCRMLAYWSDNDVSTIDRLFRKSGLIRDKWDRSIGGGETYGERTIRIALGQHSKRAA